MSKGEFSMNSEEMKSEENIESDIFSKMKKIESELPLKIIIYISIFLLTLAVVVENKINIFEYSLDPDNLYPLGVFALISLASLLCGLLVGFIFGLPRVMSENISVYSNMYGDNSNLDQISDWLLKLLIGVGLVELSKFPGIFKGIVDYLDVTFKFNGSGVVGASLLIIFSVSGFLVGYLCTRRFAALLFMKGLSGLHVIEESMDNDKEEIKKNTLGLVSENRKIIESIQNNQENFCKWMEKVTIQVNLFEKSQKNYSKTNTGDPSLQEILDCRYPVDGDRCLEKIQNLESKINKQVEERVSKKALSTQDSPNNCSDAKAKSQLQEKMKTNKDEITRYTKQLSDENREIMEKIKSNQKDFANWMGVFEDRLKAITENQQYIYHFCKVNNPASNDISPDPDSIENSSSG